jgi:Zn-dependent peptidase ImmA (M78 family)
MNFFLAKLFNSVPELNERPLAESDFYRICRREKIKVIEYPLVSSPGFYMVCKRRPMIAVDSRLHGVRRLYILWHELAHYFLHVPPHATGAHWFRLQLDTRAEFEAEVFSVIAMIPETLLRSMLSGEIEDEYGFTREILEFRLKVLDLYGI